MSQQRKKSRLLCAPCHVGSVLASRHHHAGLQAALIDLLLETFETCATSTSGDLQCLPHKTAVNTAGRPQPVTLWLPAPSSTAMPAILCWEHCDDFAFQPVAVHDITSGILAWLYLLMMLSAKSNVVSSFGLDSSECANTWTSS